MKKERQKVVSNMEVSMGFFVSGGRIKKNFDHKT